MEVCPYLSHPPTPCASLLTLPSTSSPSHILPLTHIPLPNTLPPTSPHTQLELAQDATEKRRQMEIEKDITPGLVEQYKVSRGHHPHFTLTHTLINHTHRHKLRRIARWLKRLLKCASPSTATSVTNSIQNIPSMITTSTLTTTITDRYLSIP